MACRKGALTKLGGHSVTLSKENWNTLIPKISKNWNSNDWARFEKLESSLPFTSSRSLEGDSSEMGTPADLLLSTLQVLGAYLITGKMKTLAATTKISALKTGGDEDALKEIISTFVEQKTFQDDAKVYLPCHCTFDDAGKFTGPDPECKQTCTDIKNKFEGFANKKDFHADLDIRTVGGGAFNEQMLKMCVRSKLQNFEKGDEKLTIEAVFEKLDRENGPMTTFLTTIQKMNTDYWNWVLSNLFTTFAMMLMNLQNPFWRTVISGNLTSLIWHNEMGIDEYGIHFTVMCIIWFMCYMMKIRKEVQMEFSVR